MLADPASGLSSPLLVPRSWCRFDDTPRPHGGSSARPVSAAGIAAARTFGPTRRSVDGVRAIWIPYQEDA